VILRIFRTDFRRFTIARALAMVGRLGAFPSIRKGPLGRREFNVRRLLINVRFLNA
jgi:hypothetical protein